jgi:hypothetical protein
VHACARYSGPSVHDHAWIGLKRSPAICLPRGHWPPPAVGIELAMI